MPIANCFVTRSAFQKASSPKNLISLWANESGKSADQMTINIIEIAEQLGRAYAVVANLYLPSLWSKQDLDLLQTGLAKALTNYFNIGINDVHIITHTVESGTVVENGVIVEW